MPFEARTVPPPGAACHHSYSVQPDSVLAARIGSTAALYAISGKSGTRMNPTLIGARGSMRGGLRPGRTRLAAEGVLIFALFAGNLS
ncbi:hypothetical protein MGN01_21880 [Methylobacterium gnaphalii]|uniref:Uncharacterized protein n=1 Tax=Methylobacterium gnaphalii TaxID=1010610 RepID=A0A512JK92_9HYPH|nr:hypothetical protein MGN01_21880 [Methylobacterium gnaphalii]GLS51271.1 hypothetical protein GCM10007885_41260 [Methylobacterium gnaphalii]